MKSWFRNSLFQKLFILTFLVAVVPVGLSWVYFLYIENGTFRGRAATLPVVYYALFGLTIILAAAGAYTFSRHISRPIRHFIKTATEIARGNFSQRVAVESNDEIGRLARIFNYMVTELRRLDEMNLNKIINEKNKTETILKNIADGVIVTDPYDKVLLINYAAEQWFGLKGRQVVDRSLTEVVKSSTLIEFIHSIATNNRPSEKFENIEIALDVPESRKPVLQARAAKIINDKGELIGIVTVLRDITKEKEIDRMKTELVSMVAHELRSPLTCISGFSELLLDPTITQEQSEEYATIILKESNRLSELINKFLDISKIEAGKSQLRKSPVDMKMLIEKVLDFNAQLADKKSIRVNFEAPKEVTILNLDRDMMEQAVLNLFSNAVKYSPKGARITVRLREDDSSLIFDVEDTGYGISEKSLPHIFDKFYRITDNEQVRDIMGSGLGLSLVREIVEIHGGSIKVKSMLGKGSTFTVILPKCESVQEEASNEEILS
ncbi:MAG: HAMP domain-containing protein [Calditrichaeota bacterium]|nr:MAG: HAMP domain-containing protein [Calditrichota bacterium]